MYCIFIHSPTGTKAQLFYQHTCNGLHMLFLARCHTLSSHNSMGHGHGASKSGSQLSARSTQGFRVHCSVAVYTHRVTVCNYGFMIVMCNLVCTFDQRSPAIVKCLCLEAAPASPPGCVPLFLESARPPEPESIPCGAHRAARRLCGSPHGIQRNKNNVRSLTLPCSTSALPRV